MEYKINDEVIITGEQYGHNFNIGEKVKITEVNKGDTVPYLAISLDRPDEKWYIAEQEFISIATKPDKEELEKFWDEDYNGPDYSEKPTKREIHRRICEDLNKTYIKKNTDYGDSYGQLRARYPDSILIRVFDKFSRLERLLGGNKALVTDESIEDTLMDLANYVIMEIVERRLNE